jgi:hypothetical protein
MFNWYIKYSPGFAMHNTLLVSWLVLKNLDVNDGEIWHVVNSLFVFDDFVIGLRLEILRIPLAELLLYFFEIF